jgi:hypothetical protein
MRRLSYGELRARLGLTVPVHPGSATPNDYADVVGLPSPDREIPLRHLRVPLPTLGSVDRFQ